MRNKNVWVMLAAVGVVALIFLLALIVPRRTALLPDHLVSLHSPAPEPTSAAPDGPLPSPAVTPPPAAGYVYVSAGTESRWFPLPAEGDLTFAISQTQGSEKTENVIHLTPDGVYMESATCENQDCIRQGRVTLDNKDTRVLANMIICLPNQVAIELYAPDELLTQAQQQDANE